LAVSGTAGVLLRILLKAATRAKQPQTVKELVK
jgi:hypothetical protein